jgi:hypothetical protein
MPSHGRRSRHTGIGRNKTDLSEIVSRTGADKSIWPVDDVLVTLAAAIGTMAGTIHRWIAQRLER